jgi:hypothetical protein
MVVILIDSLNNTEAIELNYLFKLDAPTLDRDDKILSEYTVIKIFDIDYKNSKHILD